MEIRNKSLILLDQLILGFKKQKKLNKNKSKKLRILCFGDSFTQGCLGFTDSICEPYGKTLSELIENKLGLNNNEYRVDIKGIDGECSSEMIYRLPGLLKKRKYNLVIILAGTNDIRTCKANKSVIQSIIHLHNSVLNNTYNKMDASTVLITIPDMEMKQLGSKNFVKDRNEINKSLINYYNNKCMELSDNKNKCIMLLDLYNAIPWENNELWDK